MSAFDIFANYGGTRADHALISWLGGFQARPIINPAPHTWWKGLAKEIPNAKLETRWAIPVHAPELKDYEGSAEFSDLSGVFVIVKRDKPRQIGTKASVLQLGELDYTGWTMSPETMAITIGNNPSVRLGALLNAARANTTFWDGANGGARFACLSGDSTKIPVNVFKKDLTARTTGLTTWYNARENVGITATNIKTAIINLQQRCGFDGQPLGFGAENLEMWVPYMSMEEARLLVEVFRQLPNYQAAPVEYLVDVGGTPQTNQQVIFSAQENPVFGRVKVRPIPTMRSDMWCIVDRTQMSGTELFCYAYGGSIGEYGVNTEPQSPTLETVPHIWTVVHGPQSPMYYEKQEIGIWNLVNEGFALASPHAIEFNYTGSAS